MDVYSKEPTTTKEAIIQINGRLDNIEKDIGEMLDVLIKDRERLHAMEVGAEKRELRISESCKDIEEMDERIDKLDSRTNWWGGGNTFLATLSIIWAWLIGK